LKKKSFEGPLYKNIVILKRIKQFQKFKTSKTQMDNQQISESKSMNQNGDERMQRKNLLSCGSREEHAFIAGLIKAFEKLSGDKSVEALTLFLLHCNLVENRFYGKNAETPNGHFVFMNEEYSLFVNPGGKIKLDKIFKSGKHSGTPKRTNNTQPSNVYYEHAQESENLQLSDEINHPSERKNQLSSSAQNTRPPAGTKSCRHGNDCIRDGCHFSHPDKREKKNSKNISNGLRNDSFKSPENTMFLNIGPTLDNTDFKHSW
jgi:hypothetical protein